MHLAILKYPSNWVIWNLFMLGGLLRHSVISNTKMIPLSKILMLQGSRCYHMCNRCLHLSRKPFWWTETTTAFFVVFFRFFSWKHNLIWSFESIDFLILLAKYTSHCPFFDYRYDCQGSNNIKNKILVKNFFSEKYLSVKDFCRLSISSVKKFRWLKVTKSFKNFVTFNQWNFNW